MPKKKEIPLYKMIIVGSGSVGKSAMTLQFMYGDFVEEYDPTSADSYRKKITLSGEEINIDILDTAGQEEYAAMRENYYRSGDGFLAVYSIDSQESFAKIEGFYGQIKEISELDHVPFILVGNKSDLKPELRQVEKSRGEELASKLGCPFFESSAKENRNVSEAFMGLVELIRNGKMESGSDSKKKKCVLQ
eukprot:TRINITY_DN14918_c0_g1_i1.p1 TRINITY_DN14918_c0_g1~~TRINITY_DN14918_c0_g1_i1.p1  ORF type:complete len:191 (-),score=47.31 TRINITY_DN14918_c0_g1_i1:162-734(-)